MADVFISYKSERRAAAEHLAEILADYGYSVWWDYGLVSGRDFGAQIEQELHAAKAVIVLWCSLSRESEWVLDEATLAKNLGTIIPTTIERIDLPLGFGRAQTLDLSDWDGAPQSHKLDRLLRDIAAKIGRAPAPNLEGLDRTERAWRRFGAPSLAHFALITPLERQAPPRTLPGAIAPAPAERPSFVRSAPSAETENGSSRWPMAAAFAGGAAIAGLAAALILSQPRPSPSETEAAAAVVTTAPAEPAPPPAIETTQNVAPEPPVREVPPRIAETPARGTNVSRATPATSTAVSPYAALLGTWELASEVSCGSQRYRFTQRGDAVVWDNAEGEPRNMWSVVVEPTDDRGQFRTNDGWIFAIDNNTLNISGRGNCTMRRAR